MKKLTILFFMAICCSVGTTYAQVEQMTNKNGVNILPEAGQFAIGFDALPFLRYAGNMFNGNTNNNNPVAGFANLGGSGIGGTLYGKYFLSETMAVRGRFGINESVTQDVNRVIMDGQAVPQNNIEVEDEMVTKDFNMLFGGGVEFRRGKGRLMGVYGGEVFMSLNTFNRQYAYGNAITADNQAPTTSNFGTNNIINGGRRVLSATAANSFGVGAFGFAGVEYFFAPQISIGAEFTLGVRYTGTNRSEVISEEWDDNSGAIIEIVDLNAGRLTTFGTATGVWGGSINLMFHF